MKDNYSQERRDQVGSLNKGGITDPTHRANLSASKSAFWNSDSERSKELKEIYKNSYGNIVVRSI